MSLSTECAAAFLSLRYPSIVILLLYYMKQIDSMLPCLFCDRSQKKSKCAKNISDTHGYCLGCQSLILTIFWTHLSSGTDQMHGNMESILFSRRPLKKHTDLIPLSLSLYSRSPINQKARNFCVGDWVCIDYFSFISIQVDTLIKEQNGSSQFLEPKIVTFPCFAL